MVRQFVALPSTHTETGSDFTLFPFAISLTAKNLVAGTESDFTGGAHETILG